MDWFEKVFEWGAWVVAGIAMALSNYINGKFKAHDVKLDSLDRDFLKYQIDANKTYVDKVEFLRLNNKLDKINDKIDGLVNTLLDKS